MTDMNKRFVLAAGLGVWAWVLTALFGMTYKPDATSLAAWTWIATMFTAGAIVGYVLGYLTWRTDR